MTSRLTTSSVLPLITSCATCLRRTHSQSRFALPPTIRQILSSSRVDEPVTVNAWVKSIRKQKRIAFGVLNDGSSAAGLQAVFPNEQLGDRVKEITNGTAVRVRGTIVESPGAGQDRELRVEDVEILGACDAETYPIQKKFLSPEYLRDNTHFRARTDGIAAMLRLRGALQRGITAYFENQDFTSTHTPILTTGDAEGGGEAFRLAPLDAEAAPADKPRTEAGAEREFFSRPAYLTVSHQLHLEALCHSMSRVYNLGPCFRAESGVTRRHLAEFWMLEAEWNVLPVADPRDQTGALCDFVEGLVKGVVGDGGIVHSEDVDLLWRHHERDAAEHAQQRAALVQCVTTEKPWTRMTYTDAIRELIKADRQWTFPVQWGLSLQSEHEKWLCETLVGGPLFVTDYPADIKAFYMKANPALVGEQGPTVGCFDLLMPHVGELAGGSVREDHIERLRASMASKGMSLDGERYGWYGQLRQYGGSPHVGFGMGFERLVSWISGVENVRECIPMPRWSGRMIL